MGTWTASPTRNPLFYDLSKCEDINQTFHIWTYHIFMISTAIPHISQVRYAAMEPCSHGAFISGQVVNILRILGKTCSSICVTDSESLMGGAP